jgi:hypothetical protein|tara:strand:+ start:995 stop:1300 length:306 start_codon:yes stop_codon:yes gene_type:complete
MDTIWVLIESIDSEDLSYPVGYYTDEGVAEGHRDDMQEKQPNCVYKIQEVELDAPPKVLDDEMKSMMDMGYVDQLIDENGDFIWEMTDKGREMMDEERKDW